MVASGRTSDSDRAPGLEDPLVDDAIRRFALMVLRDEMHLRIPDDIEGETLLGSGGLGLDSFIILQLSIRAEDEYDIELVPSFEGGLPGSIGDFVNRVDRARKA
jgi:acyl carrier protein